MGLFDFDCLVCGGDQGDIKSGGYFTNFKSSKLCVEGECKWCEGCVLRNISVKDFLKFDKNINEVQSFLQSLSSEQIDILKELLLKCKYSYNFVPHIVYGMFVESNDFTSFYTTVKNYYSKLYQSIDFSSKYVKENVDTLNYIKAKIKDSKQIELIQKNIEKAKQIEIEIKQTVWSDTRCLALLLLVYNSDSISITTINFDNLVSNLITIINENKEEKSILLASEFLPIFEKKEFVFEVPEDFVEPNTCLYNIDNINCYSKEEVKGSRLCKKHYKKREVKTLKYKTYIETTHRNEIQKRLDVIKEELSWKYSYNERVREQEYKNLLKIKKIELESLNLPSIRFTSIIENDNVKGKDKQINWTQNQIIAMLRNRFLENTISEEMHYKSECKQCIKFYKTFLKQSVDTTKPISTYKNYFKLNYETTYKELEEIDAEVEKEVKDKDEQINKTNSEEEEEDKNDSEEEEEDKNDSEEDIFSNCCLFQSYLNDSKDSSNIEWHYHSYEADGIIDQIDVGIEVSVFPDCDTLIYSSYGCCDHHISNSNLNHYERYFERSFKETDLLYSEESKEKDKTNELIYKFCDLYFQSFSNAILTKLNTTSKNEIKNDDKEKEKEVLFYISNYVDTYYSINKKSFDIPSLFIKLLIYSGSFNIILYFIKESNKKINIIDVDEQFEEWLQSQNIEHFKMKDSLRESNIPLLYYLNNIE
jgi:hypothetical protein